MATGVNVSKTNLYTVLSPVAGVNASKVIAYTVLAPSPPTPGPVIYRGSEFDANAFDPEWLQQLAIPPIEYSVISTQPFVLQLIPPPGANGYLDVLVIVQGPTLTGSGVVLGCPDNLCWGIKWGSLADLLSQQGPGRDSQRAEYCEMRYRESITLARTLPTVVNQAINGVSCQMDSVFNFDVYNPTFNQQPYGTPTALAMAGGNILAPSALVDPSNPVTISLDIVQNCPLPSNDSDPINITADVAELIVDYAEHLAAFKMGGEDFTNTIPLYQNFMQSAALYRGMMQAKGTPYTTPMEDLSKLEFSQRRLWR